MRFPARPQLLFAALSLLPSAFSFSDTSPYLIVSSSALPNTDLSTSAPVSSRSFLAAASAIVSQCSSDVYVLVSQPHVEISDLSRPSVAPHLRTLLRSVPEDRRLVAENVFVDAEAGVMQEEVLDGIVAAAVRECEADVEEVDARTGGLEKQVGEMKPKVLRVEFSAGDLAQNDKFLHSILGMLSGRLTLIYTSTPIASPSPSASSSQSTTQNVISELRRRAGLAVDEDEDATTPSANSTLPKGSLFARYQFFTPAIFMGYIIFFLLLTILYVGLSSVSSVAVSYGAFEKEMGPQAQAAKKQ